MAEDERQRIVKRANEWAGTAVAWPGVVRQKKNMVAALT
jgi:hypothetical protein